MVRRRLALRGAEVLESTESNSVEDTELIWVQRMLGVLTLCTLPVAGSAHHSIASNFDRNVTTELEGEITEILWRNPHVAFTLRTTDASGAEAEWNLETHSLSIMKRMDVAEPFVEIGDQVRVAGWPARRGQGMFVNNMLLPSGEEFVFAFGPEPADLRWSDRLWGTNERWFADSGDTSAAERGIFRVWSTSLAGGQGFFWLPEYPLTEEAQAARADFDPLTDDPLVDCALKGMPAIMSAPYPLEFIDRGDTITMHQEEYDTVRTIHMGAQAAVVPTPSILGHSTGRWVGETLVVETTAVNWGFFRGTGEYPTSDDIEFVERFTPVENGSRLQYELTVTDPATFTEPVVMSKNWVWLPDVTVEPYECIAD